MIYTNENLSNKEQTNNYKTNKQNKLKQINKINTGI